ncbi:hypothetical protein C2W62_18875 [Candidatus Entotheonella serta]|nr:hypothetical protein C2W62_18875 [Candidatus Entotheonella serta]
MTVRLTFDHPASQVQTRQRTSEVFNVSMDIIRDILPSERPGLAPLFANHRHLRPDVDAVLQGYCGSAVANAGPVPLVAQLTIHPVTFFGGAAAHPAARHLIECLVGEKLIIVAEQTWRELVFQVHGPRLTTESRLTFSPEHLNLEHLRRLATDVPHGFRIARVDLDIAPRLKAEVSADLILSEVFASPSDFVERGIGFCALAGERLVSSATSAGMNAIPIRLGDVHDKQILCHPGVIDHNIQAAKGVDGLLHH